MKKTILVLLLLNIIYTPLFAYITYIGNIRYNLNYDTRSASVISTATYTSSASSYSGNIIIPASVIYEDHVYTVTTINYHAFYKCDKLTSVSIPNTVHIIGEEAFACCAGLTSITIPNSVTNIDEGAFAQCSGLTFLTIGNEVTSIGNSAFSGCSNLTSVTIPESVTNIGSSAFAGCSSLTSIDIPSNVTYIGRSAFYDCNSIASITISEGVTKIHDCVFKNCSSLESINIPNSVETIGLFAFENCTNIKRITLGKNLQIIGSLDEGDFGNLAPGEVFRGCINLENIEVHEENPYFDSRNNCNAIIDTEKQSLIVGCKSTIIPSGIKTIEGSAFCSAQSLKSIVIPESVTSIGSSAFDSCENLLTVYCLATTPPYVARWGVNEILIEATLYVPASALELYKLGGVWSSFKNILPLTDDEITRVNGVLNNEPSVNSPCYYDLNGRCISQPHNGIYINNGKKVLLK